jgi:hypothetical protein
VNDVPNFFFENFKIVSANSNETRCSLLTAFLHGSRHFPPFYFLTGRMCGKETRHFKMKTILKIPATISPKFRAERTTSLAKKEDFTTLKRPRNGTSFLGVAKFLKFEISRRKGEKWSSSMKKNGSSGGISSHFKLNATLRKGVGRTAGANGTVKHEEDPEGCGAGRPGGRLRRGLHAATSCCCAATAARSRPIGPPISKVLTSPCVADELQRA